MRRPLKAKGKVPDVPDAGPPPSQAGILRDRKQLLTRESYACAGETNLKVRRPLNVKGKVLDSPEAAAHSSITLACEPPNNNLHYFVGRAVLQVSN